MKHCLLFLTLILTISIQPLKAQSKKELEAQVLKLTAEKDSVQQLLNKVSGQFDSVNKMYLEYHLVYKTMTEKEIPYKFKPKDIGKLLDSLKLTRDSVIAGIRARVTYIRDSLRNLNRVIDSLHTENKHLNFVINKYIGKGTVPATLKDLSGTWVLNTRWFEFANDSIQSGILLMPTPPDQNPLSKVVFTDAETALLIFAKGDSIKCFYRVNSFSSDKPYSIDLSRDSRVNIRLLANPAEGELYVSYRKGKGYFYGFIRKQ